MFEAINDWVEFLRLTPRFTGTWIFLLGLCAGSFLNVCIVRWPSEESATKGRSHCPKCKKMIPWYDNFPVLSYLILRGQCRYCHSVISVRYLLVELLSGMSWLAIYFYFGLTVQAMLYMYFISLLWIATFVDLEHQIIPDEVTIGGALIGLSLCYFLPVFHGTTSGVESLGLAARGLLTGFWILYGVAWLGEMIFRKEAMGAGDLKFLAMIGVFLGAEKTILTFFLAPLVAAPVGLFLKWRDGKEIIPFGPYLALGSVVCVFFGDKIWAWFFPF